ncbi:MAG TPA: glycosyltransferase family 4 protein [Lutibacter sp.]
MNKKINIAIYSGNIPSTTFIENLIKGISNKHEVLLFGKLKSKLEYTSKNIHCFPTFSNKIINLGITKWRTFLLLVLYPKRFQILWTEVKSFKGLYTKYQWWSRYAPVLLYLPDIFHIQWAKDLEKWHFLKEKLGCKIVLSLLGSHINYSPITDNKLALKYKQLFPEIDVFHAVSEAIALEAEKYGAVSAKIKLIHSPLNSAVFEEFKNIQKKSIAPFKIVSVGRHHWVKGYDYAISAIRILKEEGIDFEYAIIAQGEISENLLFQVNQMGLQKEVSFLKGMEQNVLFQEIKKFDVLLLPSLNEGIANVVLEAMALGVSVISTDCGGMAEVIKQGETGWLVPVRNPQAIAHALVEVQNTSIEKRQEIISNAHAFVKEQFNAKKVIGQFNDLYEEVMR